MATYYAWAPILHGAEVDDKGNITEHKRVGVGEEVSKDKLGTSDAHWQYLINAGTVRQEKYPEEIDLQSANLEAPNVVLARRAQAAALIAQSQELQTQAQELRNP